MKDVAAVADLGQGACHWPVVNHLIGMCRMDTNNNGFVTARDWGNPSIDGPLSDFTRLYVQVTRGADGRYKGAFEVSLPGPSPP